MTNDRFGPDIGDPQLLEKHLINSTVFTQTEAVLHSTEATVRLLIDLYIAGAHPDGVEGVRTNPLQMLGNGGIGHGRNEQ